MKKRMRGLSLVLVLVLVLTLALPALADGEEAAEGPLTRGEFLEALFGLTGIENMEPKQAYYDDVPMSGDLALAVRWAVGAGVVNGYGNGKFGPDDPITREQAATMIYRYAQALGKGFQGAWMFLLDYPDAGEISPWADEAMHYAVMNDILTGSEEGLFPKGTVSAEELPAILDQIRTAVIGTDADLVLTNEGLTLTIPGQTAELVIAEAPKDAEDGTLFTVSEKASVEAAEAKGGEADGAGWLFAIRRVTEEELNELLCNDMSGVTPFAKDEDSYYLFCTPTDVRIDREGDITEEDQAAWGSLNDWAAGIPEAFMEENGLEPFTRGNSDLEIYLNRILCGLETYTVSTNEFGPLEPGETDPAPFIEKLLDGAFSYTDAEAPDGEYVVLMFPNDSTRFDFFFAPDGQNLIRKVVTLEDYSSETMFQVAFEDETTANGIMSAWYDALAKDQGLK